LFGDESRLEMEGGYPSDYVFLGQRIIWASIDHRGAPSLVVMTLPEFVVEYELIITDYLEDE
jgi:hypothetical protein